jgi:hypothetical protein
MHIEWVDDTKSISKNTHSISNSRDYPVKHPHLHLHAHAPAEIVRGIILAAIMLRSSAIRWAKRWT